MKSKFFTLFAAFVLLFSAQASAQANGDVNEDGVVNEQDIAAILEIMQQAGGVKEKTKYYWYVGQENPASMTSISKDDIVDDTSSPGWRLIGTSIPTYSKTNPLWNQDKGTIMFGSTKVTAYLAIPSEDIKYRNDITGEDMTSDAWKNLGVKQINGVNYIIYESLTPQRGFFATWY